MYFLYTLLKVVSHYDLSVLSMSVVGFRKKKVLIEGWVGGVSSIAFFWGFIFIFANHHTQYYVCDKLFYNGYDSA